MTLKSNFRNLGAVELPEFNHRQLRMHQVDLENPVMPEGFEDYGAVVEALCQQAGITSGTLFMTVDEQIIEPGNFQRRPGIHVEGCWMSGQDRNGWRQYAEDGEPVRRMSAIVASSIAGCRAYPGEFEGEPKDDGDLEHIRHQLGNGLLLPGNQAFLLNPDCIHETVHFEETTQRTFFRLVGHLD